jgi:hypothetical protein
VILGDLIKQLAAADQSLVLPHGFHKPHSYRGYYTDLAFEPTTNVTVAQMLKDARTALGSTYQGYKGGDFTMGEYSDCWLAEYGSEGDGIGSLLIVLMLAVGRAAGTASTSTAASPATWGVDFEDGADPTAAIRLPAPQGPGIVTICGSTRFMRQMADADRLLTWTGHAVFKPGCDMKAPHPLWADPADAEAGKQRLDALHRDKIRRAHWVLIVGDYVGDSTGSEIAYARELGKTVRFTDPCLAREFDGEVWQPEAATTT